MEGDWTESWGELKEASKFVGRILLYSLAIIGGIVSLLYYYLEVYNK